MTAKPPPAAAAPLRWPWHATTAPAGGGMGGGAASAFGIVGAGYARAAYAAYGSHAPYAGGAAAALPQRADAAELQHISGRSMGTLWSVRLRNPQMLPLPAVRQAVQGALDRVIAQMSHWQAESELSRFNAAPAGAWQAVGPEFLAVMQSALHWAQASGGAFDPSMGALVNLWGFGPRERSHDRDDRPPPAPADIEAARARCGWQRLRLDARRGQICQPGGVLLDLSGIAKGFAADHVSDALLGLGLADTLVEVGGEIRARGQRAAGQPWHAGVLPQADGTPTHALALPVDAVDAGDGCDAAPAARLCAVATSGDQWQHFTHAGRRYAHTLDARTGQPVADAPAQVTVLHTSAMDADAIATWMTVVGPEEGLALARRHGWAVCFQTHCAADGQGGDGRLPLRMSEAFARLAKPL